MHMDDIKLFAKNEKELETLIHTVWIYSRDIGMEFGIEKCALLAMKSGKRHLNDGMHKALHPRDDVDRLYVPRKEGGRGLASIEDNVDTSIQRLEEYI